MDTLLGVTSAQIQHLRPDVEVRYQTDFYRVKALSGFREALSQITPSNYEAIIVTGLLLVVLTSKDYGTAEYADLCVINWLGHYKGLNTVIRVKWDNGIHETRIFPILQCELGGLDETPALPTALLELFSAIDFQDSDYQNLELYHEVLNRLSILYSSLREENMSLDIIRGSSHGLPYYGRIL